MAVKSFRRLNEDGLVEDLDKFSIDQACVDVDIMLENFI